MSVLLPPPLNFKLWVNDAMMTSSGMALVGRSTYEYIVHSTLDTGLLQWVQSQHVWNPDLIRVVTYRRPHYQVIPPADAFYCRSQVWLNPQLCSTLRRNPYLSIIQNRTRTFWHNISADEHHVDLSKDPTKRTEEPVRLAVLLMTSHSCLVNQIVLFLGEGGPKDLHTLISVHSFKLVQISINT